MCAVGLKGWPTLECNGVQMVKDNFFQLLINLLLFSQYDIPLPLDRTALQLRVLQDVADNIDSLRHVPAEALRVIHSLFTRGVCIQMCPKILDF
jgi:hypothetical protein